MRLRIATQLLAKLRPGISASVSVSGDASDSSDGVFNEGSITIGVGRIG